MKIALICTEKLPVPPVAGGAVQLYIEGIVPYLSRNYDITVFSIQHPGLPERETRNNVHYIRVPGGTNTIYINNLKNAVDNSYNFIHVFNRPQYVLGLMDRLPDMRFGLSLHNEMFHPEKISDADGLRCIEKVEFINTVSKYIADTVSIRFPSAAKKLHVVYSGVDTDLYKPVWSQEGIFNKNNMKYKFNLQDYKVVLFVGRLSVKKGVDVLLKAMEKVMRTNPKTALVIIGSKWYGKNESDDYTRSLQTMSQNLAGPIVFTGFIPPADIPIYFDLGDIFVCASQWNEPLARVHYEAMAAGLPIITTNRGGNAEVISGYGNGIVIDDYSNPLVMARQISFLLNNEAESLKMGGSGRRLAEQRYAWQRVASEVFQRLAPDMQYSAKADSQNGAQPTSVPVLQPDIEIASPIKSQVVVQPVLPAKTTAAVQTVIPAKTPAAVQPVIPAKTTTVVQPVPPVGSRSDFKPGWYWNKLVVPTKTMAFVQPVIPPKTPAVVQPAPLVGSLSDFKPGQYWNKSVTSVKTPIAIQPSHMIVSPSDFTTSQTWKQQKTR